MPPAATEFMKQMGNCDLPPAFVDLMFLQPAPPLLLLGLWPYRRPVPRFHHSLAPEVIKRLVTICEWQCEQYSIDLASETQKTTSPIDQELWS